MISRILGIFLVAAMLCSISSCARPPAIRIGQDAPDFTLPNLAGRTITLSDFKGKVIILDFFASWCPPCKAEVPDFNALLDEYGPEGFMMVAVAVDNPDDVKEFAINYNVNYQILVNDGKVSSLYGPIRSLPTTFVIDRQMKVARMYIGFRPKEVFENDIQELLK